MRIDPSFLVLTEELKRIRYSNYLLRMDTRMRLSLLRYVLSFSISSGLELVLMIRPTMYLRNCCIYNE